MACRVGITTNLAQRKRYWRRQHPFLQNWQSEGPYSSKSAAQAREDELAFELDCEAHPGGAGPEYANWYVYYFEY